MYAIFDKKSDSISDKHFRLIMFHNHIFFDTNVFRYDNYNACYKTEFTPTSNFEMNLILQTVVNLV